MSYLYWRHLIRYTPPPPPCRVHLNSSLKNIIFSLQDVLQLWINKSNSYFHRTISIICYKASHQFLLVNVSSILDSKLCCLYTVVTSKLQNRSLQVTFALNFLLWVYWGSTFSFSFLAKMINFMTAQCFAKCSICKWWGPQTAVLYHKLHEKQEAKICIT